MGSCDDSGRRRWGVAMIRSGDDVEGEIGPGGVDARMTGRSVEGFQ